MIKIIKELKAIYTNKKSFYNKAKLFYINDDIILLVSYNTVIISFNKNDNTLRFADNEDYYTMTTLSHVEEFLKQFNFNNLILSKSKLLKLLKENNYIIKK